MREEKFISVIVPALNEESEVAESVRRAFQVPEILEVIVADGGSRDATVDLAREAGARVVRSEPGRGIQMRAGAAEARGSVVLLLHADTWLNADAGAAISRALQRPGVVGGAFWKQFRDAPWMLRGARVRSALFWLLFRRFMGDQAIFVRRDVLEEIGGIPAIPLMEEFVLCDRLRAKGRLALASSIVTTSARRFRARGILRTYWKMTRILALYTLGASPERLAGIYRG